MATHSNTLAWQLPRMEEPGRGQSMGSLRVGHDWTTSLSFHLHALEKEMATHSSVLAWRIPGTGEPGGLLSMGSHRVRHDWSDLGAAAAAAALFWERNRKFCILHFPLALSLSFIFQMLLVILLFSVTFGSFLYVPWTMPVL